MVCIPSHTVNIKTFIYECLILATELSAYGYLVRSRHRCNARAVTA